jgi:pimeloyl-ACP methyl ester carboxylesterase
MLLSKCFRKIPSILRLSPYLRLRLLYAVFILEFLLPTFYFLFCHNKYRSFFLSILPTFQYLTWHSGNRKLAASLAFPWLADFIRYDPAPVLAKVTCPVLALNGENDTQVPAKENLESIKTGLETAGNKNVTLVELPKLNHLFQESETGLP